MAEATNKIANDTNLAFGTIRRIREKLMDMRLVSRVGERSETTWTIHKVPLPEPQFGRKSAGVAEKVQVVSEDERLISALEARIEGLEAQISDLVAAKEALLNAVRAREVARSLIEKKSE